MNNGSDLDTPTLLAQAAAAGTPLTARMLETFRMEQLIPRPVRVGGPGRAPRWIYPEGSDRQLAAVLQWRTKTKSSSLIRALLWVDGFEVPVADVQAAIVEHLTGVRNVIDRTILATAAKHGLDVQNPAERDQAIAAVAAVAASRRGPNAIPRLGRIPLHDRETATLAIIRTIALGLPVEGDVEEQAQLVERVLGISPNGRTRQIDGTGPWLTGPAAPLLEAIDVMSIPHLLTVAESATTAEFEAARTTTIALFRYLPFMIRFMGAFYDDANHIGMALLRALNDSPEFIIFLLPLIISMNRRDWENVSLLTEALAQAPAIATQTEELLDTPRSKVIENMASLDRQTLAQIQRVIDAATSDELGTPTPAWATPIDGEPTRHPA